ncbi:hypothetical protein F5884DRAFT_380699 [Xylogone sp. PMI_703]|nr:hypothetical protein F5884DRAFT_380699 [Xylogone sp. PMI_703]
MDGVRSLFFWNNSSKSKSFATYEYQLKAQAYETVAAGKEPVKGNDPVAGNGPVNLQRVLRSGEPRGQSPVSMGRGHSADGPEPPRRRRDDMQLRPNSARPPSKEHSTPTSPSWATPSFLRRMSRSNIESTSLKSPTRIPPMPPSSPPSSARILKAYEPTGVNNGGIDAAMLRHGQSRSGMSPTEALETHWSSTILEHSTKQASAVTAPSLSSHQEREDEDEDDDDDDDDDELFREFRPRRRDNSKALDRLGISDSRPLSRSRSLRSSVGGEGSASGWLSSLLSTSFSSSAEPRAPRAPPEPQQPEQPQQPQRPLSAHATYPQVQPTTKSETTPSVDNDEPPVSNQETKENGSDTDGSTPTAEPARPLRHRSGSIVRQTSATKLERRQQHIGSMKKASPRKSLPTPPSSPEKGQSSTPAMNAAMHATAELVSIATPPLSLNLDTASSKNSSDVADKRSSAGSPIEKPAADTGVAKSPYSLQSKYSTSGGVRSKLFSNPLKRPNLAKQTANEQQQPEASTSANASGANANGAEVPAITIESDNTGTGNVKSDRADPEQPANPPANPRTLPSLKQNILTEQDLNELLSRLPPPISGLTPNYINLSNPNINIDDIELMSTDSDESDDDGNVTDDDYSSSEDSFVGALDLPNQNRNKHNNLTPHTLSANSAMRPRSSSGVPSTPPRDSSRRKSASHIMHASPPAQPRPRSAIAHTSDHQLLSTEYFGRFSNTRSQRMSYISDEDYSDLSDNTDPRLRRKRSAIGEEELLFRSDGYGASGVLPGLHEMESVGIPRGLGFGFGLGLPFGSIKEDPSSSSREEQVDPLTNEAPAPVISMTRRPRSSHGPSSWVTGAAKGLGLMKKDRSASVDLEPELNLDVDNISVVDVPRDRRRASESKKVDVKKNDNKKINDLKDAERRQSVASRPGSKNSGTSSSRREGKKPKHIKNIESAVQNLGF